jgi:hypothetical protein
MPVPECAGWRVGADEALWLVLSVLGRTSIGEHDSTVSSGRCRVITPKDLAHGAALVERRHEDTCVYIRRRELIHGPLTGKVGIASPLT